MSAIGIIYKKPIKNLAPLNVRGPILSIPVSWAINEVPQINVQSKALINDKDLDICLIKRPNYRQNFFLNFLLMNYKI